MSNIEHMVEFVGIRLNIQSEPIVEYLKLEFQYYFMSQLGIALITIRIQPLQDLI